MRRLSSRSLAARVAITASTVFAVDAITKVLGTFLASAGYGRGIVLPLQNPEFSLGLAAASFPAMLVLTGLGILGLGGYSLWLAGRGLAPAWVPGLLIGGSIANLVDRAAFGAVHDWLCLGKVVINFADGAVVIGLLGYAICLASRPALVAPKRRLSTELGDRRKLIPLKRDLQRSFSDLSEPGCIVRLDAKGTERAKEVTK